jgi:hypothetical protein
VGYILFKTVLDKKPAFGSKMPILFKNPRFLLRFAINFLLKRKLSKGVYIKVVAMISSFSMSGQTSLKSILMRRYTQNTKKIFFYKVSVKMGL